MHKSLRMRALTDGTSMNAIVIGLIRGYLGDLLMVESVPSGDSAVTEIVTPAAVPKKPLKREVEWAQGMCPKHGRMAINGKFTCC